MGHRAQPDGPGAGLIGLLVVGLGPGSLGRIPESTRELLLDPATRVIVRTLRHPAAAELADLREVESCDDLYDQKATFEDVYDAIADRVVEAARSGPTIYAVPGSPLVGELAIERIRSLTDARILAGESFVDAVLAAVGYDPLDRGLRLLNGHRMPHPLVIDGPTIVAHLDLPVVLAEVSAMLSRVTPEDTRVALVIDAGGPDERLIEAGIGAVDSDFAGPRTSLFVDPVPGGLVGAIRTMARLREECPWDRRQTHQTLVKNLIEETYELVEAIGSGSEGEIEDELGDVLLQVLFHANIARQAGAFDIEDVAENLRQKLVRRHPHVFGDVEAGTAEEVKANWELIKQAERNQAERNQAERRDSVLDGVPIGLPALERAGKIQRKAAEFGFDWPEVLSVVDKIVEETNELRASLTDTDAAAAELGDLLFSVVNLARHLKVDPELALRGAIDRFDSRFREMEAIGDLRGLSLQEMDQRWEQVKRRKAERESR